jgi:catechol-2,3-dioxygenase
MRVMIGKLEGTILDCPDPAALATFYSAVLGLPIVRADDNWVTIGGNGQPQVSFQQAPDHQPPKWLDPDHPQQFHFDIHVDDIEAGEQQVLALGASRLGDGDGDFRVYADPAGHPFCLVYDA